MRVRRAPAGVLGPGLALVLLASGLLSGCSDDPADAHRSTSQQHATASATASPTGSATASATGPATGSATGSGGTSTTGSRSATAPRSPAATKGKAGQQRFARYVMTLWGYGLRTDDSRPLTGLSLAKQPCEGCAGYARTLRTRKKQGWYVDFAGVDVRHVTDVKVDGTTSVVRATVNIPQSQSLNRDGTFRNTSRGHAGATFEVAMRWTKHRYRLLAFSVR